MSLILHNEPLIIEGLEYSMLLEPSYTSGFVGDSRSYALRVIHYFACAAWHPRGDDPVDYRMALN